MHDGEFDSGFEFVSNLLIDGNNSTGSTEVIFIELNTLNTLDISGWGFSGWGGQGEHTSILGSASNDTITGTISDDIIDGGAGNDTLEGSQGDDLFSGRGGADTMTGNGGADTFFYSAVGESTSADRDHITDFTTGDLIDLSSIDANTGLGGDQAFTFIGSALFTAAGQLRAVNRTGDDWTVQVDNDGDGIADLAILATSADGNPLDAGDFVL